MGEVYAGDGHLCLVLVAVQEIFRRVCVKDDAWTRMNMRVKETWLGSSNTAAPLLDLRLITLVCLGPV